ncbi:MAG: hypothetical protein H7039_03165 [Bryobacteraceae bacterium]|nr:hypothetical protein [Bryobacteraceae bacterium]
MSIDERIERLTERHEALAQSVEMLLASQRLHEEQHSREMTDVRGLLAETVQSISALARIAESHEHRIEDLEEGTDK